jgi:molybdopterin synthase sulfur carrier subunit
MVTVEFLGPIKKDKLRINISNINELSKILKTDIELIPWLDNSAVAVNDTLIQDKNFVLNDGDKVSLLPPVCGG